MRTVKYKKLYRRSKKLKYLKEYFFLGLMCVAASTAYPKVLNFFTLFDYHIFFHNRDIRIDIFDFVVSSYLIIYWVLPKSIFIWWNLDHIILPSRRDHAACNSIYVKIPLLSPLKIIKLYRISSPMAAVCNVSNFAKSTMLLATTTLRTVLGTKTLAEILSEREAIAAHLIEILDDATDPWGVKARTS